MPPHEMSKRVHARAAAHQLASRRKPDDPRFNQMQQQLSDQQKQLASTREDMEKTRNDFDGKLNSTRTDLDGKLTSTRDELNGSIARTHDQLVALEKRGERNYYEFKLDKSKTRATLIVGGEDWPFPVPIVKAGKSWFFDTKAGRQELLFRRVGQNELDAIQICRGYVEAQHEYALAKRTAGVNQYAQRIISTEGQQDGLAWKNPDGTWDGPVGEKVAAAIARGYSSRTEPFHGYFFKVLKGQGPAAMMGEMDFVVNGAMIAGFALVAAPAQHRVTGVKTFMVGPSGVVYEKDLGPDTLKTFEAKANTLLAQAQAHRELSTTLAFEDA
jgi:hypothetical protein